MTASWKGRSFFVPVFCLWVLMGLSSGVYSDALPNWVNKPEKDNNSFIYGIGSGLSLESARANAYNEIASKVDVMISSVSLAEDKLMDDQFSSAFESSVKATVDDVVLSHISLDRSTQRDDLIWTRYALDKSAFTAAQTTQIAQERRELMSIMSVYQLQSLFGKMSLVPILKEHSAQSLNRIRSVRALVGEGSQGISDVDFITALQTIRFDQARSVIALEMDGDADILATEVEKFVSQAGYRIGEEGSDGLMQIDCANQIVTEKEVNESLLNCQITLMVGEQRVGGIRYTGKGRSYRGEQDALRMASLRIFSQIKRKPLGEALGFPKIEI